MLDDVRARVKALRFPVYRLRGWTGSRRVTHVLGTDAVSLLHKAPPPSRAWVEVQTRLLAPDAVADPEAEAEAALEEVLWGALDAAGVALPVVDADAEILGRARQAPHRWITIAADGGEVDLLMVGDAWVWAAWGRLWCVAVRITAEGVQPAAVAIEQVSPRDL